MGINEVVYDDDGPLVTVSLIVFPCSMNHIGLTIIKITLLCLTSLVHHLWKSHHRFTFCGSPIGEMLAIRLFVFVFSPLLLGQLFIN